MFEERLFRYLVMLVMAVAVASLVFIVVTGANAQEIQWQEHAQTVTLKMQEFRYKFSYPQGWFISATDPAYVSVQNVAPSDGRVDDLAEGFVKVSFVVDPKANPNVLLHGNGEPAIINGLTWRRLIHSGEAAGDRSITLETVRDGAVFRIYAYIARTGGHGSLFDRQVAIVNQIVASLQFEPVIQYKTIPGIPTYPAQGKPEATPIGLPRAP